MKNNFTISDYQKLVEEIYGLSNDRYFSTQDMLANIERFLMRALKGIRKHDEKKTVHNLLIAQSWLMSLMNQFHINLEEVVWNRFPYICSYCGRCPCECKAKKIKTRQKIKINKKLKPKSFSEFQEMFEKIYPSTARTLDQAGVHLVEEIGELSESFMAYRGSHDDKLFNQVILEAADLFSCISGVFNSLGVSDSKEIRKLFNNNCHVCKKAPCECNFVQIINYKS